LKEPNPKVLDQAYLSLSDYLRTFLAFSPEAESEIRNKFQFRKQAKGFFFSKKDEVCQEVYFLVKGACRYFHFKENKEITHWFGFEGSFVTSFYSFTTQQPSFESIQLIEPGILLSISYCDLIALYSRYHDWERAGRLVVEEYARRLMGRLTSLQALTAIQRYALLFQQEPRILQRIPLGHVSSYLGMSQETLSRVRAQIRDR
jgi:CRP-like cAMP-binding protein